MCIFIYIYIYIDAFTDMLQLSDLFNEPLDPNYHQLLFYSQSHVIYEKVLQNLS